MGWRDRDWAKFTDAEWKALYGVRRGDRASTVDDAVLPSHDWIRLVVWCAIAAAVAGVGLLVYSGRPAGANGAGPRVLYGVADSAGSDVTPGGLHLVCTEEALQVSGNWICLEQTNNVHNVPVLKPRPYAGACAHVVADQSRGAWLCLDAGTLPQAPT